MSEDANPIVFPSFLKPSKVIRYDTSSPPLSQSVVQP